jgi:hypothetical protein
MQEPTQRTFGEGRRRRCQGSNPIPVDDPAGVVAMACLHRENGRNTGSPSGGTRVPTGHPRGLGWAAWGGGQAPSTVEAG